MSDSISNQNSPKYSYEIKLDIEEDAWNWYVSCNRISKGVDWKKRMPKEVVGNIHGKTKEEAHDFLIPFLKQKYVDEKEQIDDYTKYINHQYQDKFIEACKKIVDLTSKPLYRDEFTIFLTTFPRGPYNYKLGYLWQYVGYKGTIVNFMHEALHIQFFHYWYNNPNSAVSKLDDEQYEFFKESLTVILDEELYPLIEFSDRGYDMHKEFRKELHEFWKINKDFDKLVDFGLKRLPHFVSK